MKSPLIKQITLVQYNKDDNSMDVSGLGDYKILDVGFIRKYFEQACMFTEDEAKAEADKFVWSTTNKGAKVTATFSNNHTIMTFHQDQEHFLHWMQMTSEVKAEYEEHYKTHYEVVFDEPQRVLFERSLAILHAIQPQDEELNLLHGMIQSLKEDNKESTALNRITHGLCL
jgi:hypothetical protein